MSGPPKHFPSLLIGLHMREADVLQEIVGHILEMFSGRSTHGPSLDRHRGCHKRAGDSGRRCRDDNRVEREDVCNRSHDLSRQFVLIQ